MRSAYAPSKSENQGRPKSWRDVLPIHPAAELFPMMSRDELCELAADIKANTLQMPIVMWSSDPSFKSGSYINEQAVPKNLYLLDGRNRLDSLELNGVKLVTDNGKFDWFALQSEAVGGLMHVSNKDDPYAYVVSVNIRRRHLTQEQKRELIEKLLKAKPETSNLQIAKQVKADDKTVAKVRTELEATSEIPKLIKTVGKDGKSRPARQKRATEKVTRSLNGSAPTSDMGATTAPKPDTFAASAKALSEFKYACDHWLPKMVPEHRSEAVKFVAGLVSS